MITIGRDGERFVWHRKAPGMTWTSRERFATLPDAVAAGRTVALGKGEKFMEPDIDIWQDDDPMTWDSLLVEMYPEADPSAPEPPFYYTREVDNESAEQLYFSLELAGAIE